MLGLVAGFVGFACLFEFAHWLCRELTGGALIFQNLHEKLPEM